MAIASSESVAVVAQFPLNVVVHRGRIRLKSHTWCPIDSFLCEFFHAICVQCLRDAK